MDWGEEISGFGCNLPRMRMVMVIFRQSLEVDILRLFKELHVEVFTGSPRVFRVRDVRSAIEFPDCPGHNCFVSALPDEQAGQVAVALEAFRDCLEQWHGAPIPLRVFLLPGEQVVQAVQRR
jgi:hypothetical protein